MTIPSQSPLQKKICYTTFIKNLNTTLPDMREKFEIRSPRRCPSDLYLSVEELQNSLELWEQSTYFQKEKRCVASDRIVNYVTCPPEINLLNLRNLHLSSIPNCLEYINIQYLDLSNNNIRDLQKELINLSTKCYVNITGNPLTPNDIHTVQMLSKANSAEYNVQIGAPKYKLIYNNSPYATTDASKINTAKIVKSILFCC